MAVVSVGQITLHDTYDGLNLQLSSYSFVVPTNDQGAAGNYSGCSTTAKVMNGNQDVTTEWMIQVASPVGITGSLSGATYTVSAMTLDIAVIDFTASRLGYPDLTARFNVTKSKNAADGLTIVLSNESHTLPADNAGAALSYSNSGTTIRVLEGSTELNAASSNSANGSFTVGTPVVSPSGKITAGGRSYSSKTATISNHSAMAADTDSVTITYPINIRRSNGTTVSLSKTQTITKSKQGGTGGRGTVHVYAATVGTAWNDSEANAALAVAPHNGKIVADRVTLYNSTAGWTQTRYWTGSAWTVLGEVIDGNLLVTGSITADKISINDLFARTITLPNDGVLKAGTTEDYAELGGTNYFKAQAGNSTIFKIAKAGSHFIDGRFITNTLPPEAFDANVIPYIRSQLSLGTPSAGGSSSTTGILGGYGVMLTTTETIASSGVGEPASIVVGYGGIEVSVQSMTLPSAAPKITLQVQRITNGGSPVNVGTLKEFIGEFRRTASGSPATYEFSVPSFRVLETDSAPGAGNLQYKAVISLISPINLGDDLGIVTLSASQRAAGAVSGTITWDSVLGKPNVSLVGHTHSAADIGALPDLSYNNDTTFAPLISGTVAGKVIESWNNGHLVVALNSNDDNDSFAVVSRYGGVFDRVPFRIRANGNATILGSVTAASFNGDGSGLANVVASSVLNGVYTTGNQDIAGTKKFASQVQITTADALRMVQGNYGAFFRNDGSNLYLMLTDSGNPYGGWNTKRPLVVNLASGLCSINGGLNGNASSATNLQTARIFTIGNAGKAFNGSVDVSWSLSEIGALGNSGKQIISKAAHVSGSTDCHLELQAPTGSSSGEVSILLHQQSRFYGQMRLRSDGFHFTQGDSNAYRDIYALNFMGNLVGNAATSTTATTAGSITGFNNPTTAATGSTIAYRDGSADVHARLFRSNYGNQTTISGAMAFRINNDSDNYIRFCSDTAAIRSWLGANDAGNLTTGILPDGRFAGAYTGIASLTSERYIANSNNLPALQANTNYTTYGFGFDSTINVGELILLATVTPVGSSRNYLIKGVVNTQSSSSYGLLEFNVAIRTNTLPSKSIIYTRDSLNVGRDVELYVYNDTASNNVYICAVVLNSSGQNIAGKLDVYTRGNYYNNITVQNSKVILDPTGLTLINPSSTGARSTTENVVATSFSSELFKLGSAGGTISPGAGQSLRVQTSTGYIDVGSTNASYTHFSTDRPAYYFNKSIQVDGEFKVYGTGTGLNNNGLFFSNGETTLTSGNSGGLIITGLDNDSALTFRTNGGIDRGHLYADSSNNIGFLDQNAGWKLRVDSAGMLHVADGTSTSDRSVKRNIEPIQDALAKVNTLTGNTYDQIEMGIRRAGPIAQEVQVVLPEAVSADEKGKLAVSQMGLIALLIEAVKDLSTEVDTLKRRLH